MQVFVVPQHVTFLPVCQAPMYRYADGVSSHRRTEGAGPAFGTFNGNCLNVAQNDERSAWPLVVSTQGSLQYYEHLHPVTVCPEALPMYGWHQRPHTIEIIPYCPCNSLVPVPYKPQRSKIQAMDVTGHVQYRGLTQIRYIPPTESQVTRGQMQQQQRMPRMKQPAPAHRNPTPVRSVMESLPKDVLSPDYKDPDVSMMVSSMDYFYNVSTYGITNLTTPNNSREPM